MHMFQGSSERFRCCATVARTTVIPTPQASLETRLSGAGNNAHEHVTRPVARRTLAGVLVTGSHRSGTTWVGRMIAAAPGTCYLHEPFKPRWDPPYVWTRFDTWFLYLNETNAAPFERAVADTLGLRYSWRRHYAFEPGMKQA